MDKINSIKVKVERIEKLLADIRSELETLGKEEDSKDRKPQGTQQTLPSDVELRWEYEMLYREFTASNSKALEEFIKGKSKAYLKAFCKANNLPVDTSKISKERIVDAVRQWMAQRRPARLWVPRLRLSQNG